MSHTPDLSFFERVTPMTNSYDGLLNLSSCCVLNTSRRTMVLYKYSVYNSAISSSVNGEIPFFVRDDATSLYTVEMNTSCKSLLLMRLASLITSASNGGGLTNGVVPLEDEMQTEEKRTISQYIVVRRIDRSHYHIITLPISFVLTDISGSSRCDAFCRDAFFFVRDAFFLAGTSFFAALIAAILDAALLNTRLYRATSLVMKLKSTLETKQEIKIVMMNKYAYVSRKVYVSWLFISSFSFLTQLIDLRYVNCLNIIALIDDWLSPVVNINQFIVRFVVQFSRFGSQSGRGRVFNTR